VNPTPAFLLWVAALVTSPPAQGPWGVAYAPADAAAPRPALVFLHGMWASPEDSCPLFQAAATPFGFLVCPRGNAPLAGGRMWVGNAVDAAGPIHAALDAAERMVPGKLDRGGAGTLIGFSNGAYFAAEMARLEPGKWPGLVLISMKLDLDAAELRAAGVHRVALMAGDQDDSGAPMLALAKRLDGAGLPARFISLGPVGHAFPPDMPSLTCGAIAWVRAADGSPCSGL
jgi:predicted esterase